MFNLLRSDLPIPDLHTRISTRLIYDAAVDWRAHRPDTAAAVRLPSNIPSVPSVPVFRGILSVPALMEPTGTGRPCGVPLLRRIKLWLMKWLPVSDDPASIGAAATLITEHFERILPKRRVTWLDPTSDIAIERMALQGLGAHRLEPIEQGPAGARFKIDFSWMHGLPVRKGLEPYGACAYFSKVGQLLCIYTSHDDQMTTPEEAGWEGAKWRWRCALFTAVTVTDHLGSAHLLASNIMLCAARDALPTNHPLRRLLQSFTHGTAAINLEAALALAPERGLAHRLFGFTYEGLRRCLLFGIENVDLRPFPQVIAEKRADSLGQRYLYKHDGLALYAIFDQYTRAFLGTPNAPLAKDVAVRAWWRRLQDLAPYLRLGPLASEQQVYDLVSQFMFMVTGYHAQVGNVADYFADPHCMGTKIRSSALEADAQSTIQVLNLIAFTSLAHSPLIGDYRVLCVTAEEKAAFTTYQAQLQARRADIEVRNKDATQPYQTLNPGLLSASVSH